MKNIKKGLLHLAIILAVMALFAVTVIVGLGRHHKGSAENILLGLDLAGGVSITYETVEDCNADEMSDTVYKLQKRAESYNTESQVYQEGNNRINVDIPDAENPRETLEKMGSAGALYFISNDVYNEAKANYPTTLNEKGQEVFPEGVQFSEIVCEGSDIADATAGTIQEQTTGINKNVVDVEFSPSGANKFADASTSVSYTHLTLPTKA